MFFFFLTPPQKHMGVMGTSSCKTYSTFSIFHIVNYSEVGILFTNRINQSLNDGFLLSCSWYKITLIGTIYIEDVHLWSELQIYFS